MRYMKNAAQAGFTLVELIIVIVILGILAAVAIPNLTSTSGSAYAAKQQATLGALKSAWSVAYAVKKASPNSSDVAAQMSDPACTSASGAITCTGITLTTGSGSATFGTGSTSDTTAITTPSAISITSG